MDFIYILNREFEGDHHTQTETIAAGFSLEDADKRVLDAIHMGYAEDEVIGFGVYGMPKDVVMGLTDLYPHRIYYDLDGARMEETLPE